MTSRDLVKFNLDYVINTATHWNRKDLERNAYLDAPFIRLENYTWFCCPLEFYAEKIQKDYYESYREEGDHELVSCEEFHTLIKSHDPRKKSIDLKYLQEVIHKYKLYENSFLITWLAKYLVQEKIEVFWAWGKRNDVKFYYQRYEKREKTREVKKDGTIQNIQRYSTRIKNNVSNKKCIQQRISQQPNSK
jgi:hypothetical protein